MKMIVYKLCIAILIAFSIELVNSAPSLNKSPKVSSDLVMIAANDDILLSEETSSLRTSNHSLNSTHLDSETSSGKAKLVNTSSTAKKQSAIKSKSLNLTSTNTSLMSNFTASGSQPTTDLMNLLIDFFLGIFDAPIEKSTIPNQHTSTSSPISTFSVQQSHRHHSRVSHEHNSHSSINPSFYHFSSPSLRLLLPFGRFFRNL